MTVTPQGLVSVTNADGSKALVPASVSVGTDGTPGSAGLTDVQLRATPVPVSGPLTDAQLRATPVTVTTLARVGYNACTVADYGIPTTAIGAFSTFWTMYGSATKAIQIHWIKVSGPNLTAVSYGTILLSRRSGAPTGGTAVVLVPAKMDPNSPAATATNLAVWSVYPTGGTDLAETIQSESRVFQGTPATAAGVVEPLLYDFRDGAEGPLILRGPTDGIALSLRAAKASICYADISVGWSEV